MTNTDPYKLIENAEDMARFAESDYLERDDDADIIRGLSAALSAALDQAQESALGEMRATIKLQKYELNY